MIDIFLGMGEDMFPRPPYPSQGSPLRIVAAAFCVQGGGHGWSVITWQVR